MEKITPEWIDAQHRHLYRSTAERRLKTAEEARAFVEEVGFCHFWPIKEVELPSLWVAVAGDRPVADEHDDPGHVTWGWKDGALGKKWWYYGKLLRRRATLVSLELLPSVYAASENFGELTDYIDEYRSGQITAEAKDIYEALLENGPLDTVRLRKEARMSADSAKARFERALLDLQVGLKVIPVGVAEVGAWHYAFIYEILPRHFPDLPECAHSLSRFHSQQTLIQKYVDNVVCSDQAMIGKVFHVLKWSNQELAAAIEALLQSGALQEVQVEGAKSSMLATQQTLDGRELRVAPILGTGSERRTPNAIIRRYRGTMWADEAIPREPASERALMAEAMVPLTTKHERKHDGKYAGSADEGANSLAATLNEHLPTGRPEPVSGTLPADVASALPEPPTHRIVIYKKPDDTTDANIAGAFYYTPGSRDGAVAKRKEDGTLDVHRCRADQVGSMMTYLRALEPEAIVRGQSMIRMDEIPDGDVEPAAPGAAAHPSAPKDGRRPKGKPRRAA